MNINILGTNYKIEKRKESEDPILNNADGYSDWTEKLIVVGIFEKDDRSLKNLKEYERKVLRHEIIHAFLDQSGLACNSDWARNEEMIDFFAIQFPKMMEAMKSVEVL